MSESELNEKKKFIVAVWKLVSFKLFAENDLSSHILEPHGDKPMGLAIFTASGYMSGTVEPPQPIAAFGKKSWFEASDADIVSVAKQFSTYSGPYRLKYSGQELILECDVEISLNPAWLGTTEIRRHVELFEKDGEKFMLLQPEQKLPLPVSRPLFEMKSLYRTSLRFRDLHLTCIIEWNSCCSQVALAED